eukprot:6199432-Pleurochrysis_carterae.AAC.6
MAQCMISLSSRCLCYAVLSSCLLQYSNQLKDCVHSMAAASWRDAPLLLITLHANGPTPALLPRTNCLAKGTPPLAFL